MKPKDSNILDTNNLYKGLIMIQPIEIKNKIWTFLETLKTLENLKFLVLPLNKDPILVKLMFALWLINLLLINQYRKSQSQDNSVMISIPKA